MGSQAQPKQQVNATREAPNSGEKGGPDKKVHGVVIDRFNDPSAGSPRVLQDACHILPLALQPRRPSSNGLPLGRDRLCLKLPNTKEPTTI